MLLKKCDRTFGTDRVENIYLALYLMRHFSALPVADIVNRFFNNHTPLERERREEFRNPGLYDIKHFIGEKSHLNECEKPS